MNAKKQAISIILIAAVIFSLAIPALAAGDGFECLEPIPLLVIKISFDASGNGENDFETLNGSKLYADKTSEFYGEQWCYSKDSYWYTALFSDANKASMKNFYKTMSGGKFWFSPAEETYENSKTGGVVNDGIVEVVVPHKHPYAKTGNQTGEDSASRTAALKAADEYVDFASFDKDGNGSLSYDELAIVYVCGGYEYSAGSSRPSDKLAFGVHAHFTTGSAVKLDGVSAGSRFVRIGEYLNTSSEASVGVIAHELGHFIGAADLYDTSSSSSAYDKYVSTFSLMASGSWNSKSGARGSGPAYMDPFNAIVCGIAEAELITEDGEYTLYSHQSRKGEYNILKITTQNPLEYYLIENRYAEDTPFDSGFSSDMQGIIIWHIDESIISNNSGINKSGAGHDPGVAIMGTSSITPRAFRYIDGSINGQSYTFTPNSTKYRFPISETCFTLLSGEDAELFGTTASVLSYAGDEMTIKIENVMNIPPTVSFAAHEKTTESLEFGGAVTSYNGGKINDAYLILSKNSVPTEENGTKVAVAVDEETGRYLYKFEGLTENTKYFCRLVMNCEFGTIDKISVGYTQAIPKERTDYYVIYCYKHLTDVERSYEVRVKPGEVFTYAFPMTKNGYTFCGWYLDEELTERFDMGFTQEKCLDFALYAKWVENGGAANLILSGATAKYPVFAAEVGDTFAEPIPEEKAGYTFCGWYADEDFSTLYDFAEMIEEPEDVTVYAKWEKNSEETTSSSEKVTETTSSAETDVTTKKPSDTEKKNPAVIIVICIAVLCVLAAAVIFIKKQKIK